MPRPNPVTKQDVIEALRFWHGNVASAAKLTLKISRQALYEKLNLWGLHPEEYRGDEGVHGGHVEGDSVNRVGDLASDRGRGMSPLSRLDAVMDRVGEAVVGTVMEVAMEAGERIRRRTPVQHPKLPPAMVEEIQTFRLRLQAMTGEETSNSEIDQRFHRLYFQRFAEAEMAKLKSEETK